MRTLVTGSHGFLGRHLVPALRQRGDEVVEPQGDLRKPETLAGAGHVDLVYHLAAQSHVPTSVQDPVGTWDNNVGSTLQLLEWARKAEPARIVLLSSAHVYGAAHGKAISEDQAWAPRNPYGASKAATEAVGGSWAATYGLDVVRVRPFNIYGPGQAKGFLVPDILEPLAAGQAPELGDPAPRRDFTFVEDAVTFLVETGRRPDARGEAINLGSGSAHSVEELAALACRVSGTGLAPRFKPSGKHGDVLFADVSKAHRLLGWKPRFSLEEGLARCWHALRAARVPRQRQS